MSKKSTKRRNNLGSKTEDGKEEARDCKASKPVKTDKERHETAVRNIMDNYAQVERSIVQQLYMKQDIHPLTAGTEREDIWEQLFQMLLPRKFVIEHSVFIIDSQEGLSREVDLAVMDETYTPYIFRYGRLKFIPIEAVAAVIECKSGSLGQEGIRKWAESIQKLRTSDESIARTAMSIAVGGTMMQQSTRPLRILCNLKENVKEEISQYFDFVVMAVQENPEKKAKAHIEIKCTKNYRTLMDWFLTLNFNGRYEDTGELKETEKPEETRETENAEKSGQTTKPKQPKEAITEAIFRQNDQYKKYFQSFLDWFLPKYLDTSGPEVENAKQELMEKLSDNRSRQQTETNEHGASEKDKYKQKKSGRQVLENTVLSDDFTVYEPAGKKAGKAPLSLLTFHFQINQLLMLINNPLLFPHRKYVEMFNRIGGNQAEGDGLSAEIPVK